MKELYNYNGGTLGIADYVTPEMFGAFGNGTADDSQPIQNALNHGGLIRFSTGAVYRVTATLRVKGDTIIDLNGATILSENKHLFYNFQNDSTATGYNGEGNITIMGGTIIGGAISFGHGDHIWLVGMQFKDSLNDHFLEICACRDYEIVGCSFFGMADVQTSVYEYINIDPCTHGAFPWLPNGSAFYDGTVNNGVTVRDCRFGLGSGEYAYGYNAVGAHTGSGNTHIGIAVIGCAMRGFTGCGVRLNDMASAIVKGCDIRVPGDGIRVGDVAACDDVVIIDNLIQSTGGSRIAITSGRVTTLTRAVNISIGEDDET